MKYRLKNARYHKVMCELFEVRGWHESFDEALSYAADDYFSWLKACQDGEYDEELEDCFKVCDGCEDHYFSPDEVEVVLEEKETSEKLEDRAVYCLRASLDAHITLEIYRLGNMHMTELDDETNEDRVNLIVKEQCGEFLDLGYEIYQWPTMSEDRLWDVVELLLGECVDMELKNIVDRFVQFKLDGKFDGEEK